MTDSSPSAEKPTAKSRLKGDDRNVVAVDPASAGISLEDRLFLVWKNNRTSILAVLVAALVVIVGRFAWNAYAANQESATRAEFQAAKTPDAKRAFARSHAGHALAGVALLAIADDSYAAADYSGAARTYAEAAAALTEPALASRAHLGEGIAAIQAGDAARGEPIVRKIAMDPQALVAMRCEAWCTIASLKIAERDGTAAREALTKLMELKPSQAWMNRAMGLNMLLPPEAAVPAPAAGPVATP